MFHMHFKLIVPTLVRSEKHRLLVIIKIISFVSWEEINGHKLMDHVPSASSSSYLGVQNDSPDEIGGA